MRGWARKIGVDTLKQPKMEIVDTHMHLWSPKTHPWVLNVKDGGHPAGKFGRPK